jgi:hypothetical protein
MGFFHILAICCKSRVYRDVFMWRTSRPKQVKKIIFQFYSNYISHKSKVFGRFWKKKNCRERLVTSSFLKLTTKPCRHTEKQLRHIVLANRVARFFFSSSGRTGIYSGMRFLFVNTVFEIENEKKKEASICRWMAEYYWNGRAVSSATHEQLHAGNQSHVTLGDGLS